MVCKSAWAYVCLHLVVLHDGKRMSTAICSTSKGTGFGGSEAYRDLFVHLMSCLHAQAIIRAVCTIIDAFHFDLPPVAADSEEATVSGPRTTASTALPALPPANGRAQTASTPTEQGTTDGPNADADGDAAESGHSADTGQQEAAAEAAHLQADIQRALVKRILPALSEQLVVKNEVRPRDARLSMAWAGNQ